MAFPSSSGIQKAAKVVSWDGLLGPQIEAISDGTRLRIQVFAKTIFKDGLIQIVAEEGFLVLVSRFDSVNRHAAECTICLWFFLPIHKPLLLLPGGSYSAEHQAPSECISVRPHVCTTTVWQLDGLWAVARQRCGVH